MKPFEQKFLDFNYHKEKKRKPDFENFLSILRRERPKRPTVFELSLNQDLYNKFADSSKYNLSDELDQLRHQMEAFINAGYDYVTMHACSDFTFKTERKLEEGTVTVSLNAGAMIHDRKSFEEYEWPDPDKADYSRLEKLKKDLPGGMKIIVFGPGGVLENVIALIGYENLCYMLIDEPELVEQIFNEVGKRFIRYYQISSEFDTVGAVMSNDDWGFSTQTMLSVRDMKKYVIPWHKKIVEAIHASGKPALLHSCGKLDLVMDDIIDNIGYNAKHSYEDKIIPIEKAFRKYGERIAIIGGIDLDFICRSTPEEVYKRAVKMLELTSGKGGYALGSGNSIPAYVPDENYLALISAAIFNEY